MTTPELLARIDSDIPDDEFHAIATELDIRQQRDGKIPGWGL